MGWSFVYFVFGKAFCRRFSSFLVMAMTVPWRGVNAPCVAVSCTRLNFIRSLLVQNW